MNVLVPAAKAVPEELQKIGKMPAVIYPVNDKIVFDYLHQQYNSKCDLIKILCFEKAEIVHRRLDNYDKCKVKIEDLPELRDLGYTIYKGLETMQGSVVVNFADTIVSENICDESGDCFLFSENYTEETWTYFEESNGHISRIFDKPQTLHAEKKPLFVGVFKFMHAEILFHCLEEELCKKNDESDSFFRALMRYSALHPLRSIRTHSWLDIGHSDRYAVSQLAVKAREFNHITIDTHRGILRKTSDDKEKFIGEILWYQKLPLDIEYIRPRIFAYSTSYEAPYVSMEYYSYHTVHDLFLYGDLSYNQWRAILDRIRFACEEFGRYTVKDQEKIAESLKEMYISKTMSRIGQMKMIDAFNRFFDSDFCINGVTYRSLNWICSILFEVIPQKLLSVDHFSIIHGDLCFTNIMVDRNYNFIKVIDPRGKFGLFDIYGDKRYELAKLLHSIDGKYDFIIKDQFKIEYDVNQGKIEYHVKDRARDFDLYTLFLSVFEDEIQDDLQKIELIEALLFISMIPLHKESLDHQMAMLATGISILNRVVDIRK